MRMRMGMMDEDRREEMRRGRRKEWMTTPLLLTLFMFTREAGARGRSGSTTSPGAQGDKPLLCYSGFRPPSPGPRGPNASGTRTSRKPSVLHRSCGRHEMYRQACHWYEWRAGA